MLPRKTYGLHQVLCSAGGQGHSFRFPMLMAGRDETLMQLTHVSMKKPCLKMVVNEHDVHTAHTNLTRLRVGLGTSFSNKTLFSREKQSGSGM